MMSNNMADIHFQMQQNYQNNLNNQSQNYFY
jgi:hypothetical protein